MTGSAWALFLCIALGAALASCAPPNVRKLPHEAQDRNPPPRAVVPSSRPAPAAPPLASLPPAAARVPERRIELTPPPGIADRIPVGLLLPLSGQHEALGRSLLDAAQLALFEVAGENFVLMPRDTAGTAEGAAAAARSALESGAKLLLGPVFAASAAAVAPIARDAGVNLIAFTNDSAVAAEGAFVLGFLPSQRIERVVSYAASRGASRFAALVPRGAFGELVRDAFVAAVARAGGTVVRIEPYRFDSEGSIDDAVKRLAAYDLRRGALRAQRAALAQQTDEASRRALQRLERRETIGEVDFDAVLLPEADEPLKALAPLLPYYDIDTRKVRILGIADWSDRALVREPALAGAWFAAPAPDARAAFADRFRRIYGTQAHSLAPLAYDAAALAAVLGAREGGADYSIDALAATNGFAGSAGLFRLRRNGLGEHSFAVFEVRPDGAVAVSPAPETFEVVGN